MERDQNEQSRLYDIMPKDVACIITNKIHNPDICCVEVEMNHGEALRMSNTWNTLQITHQSIFDHQFWWNQRGEDPVFRFDNDAVNDCNEFYIKFPSKKIGREGGRVQTIIPKAVRFDGPNHDGGEHKGVIAVAHTYNDLSGEKELMKTVFHLFKLHGCPAAENKGAWSKRQVPGRAHTHAIVHEKFPYTSDVFQNETFDYCALARKKMVALATEYKKEQEMNHILRIFSYTVQPMAENQKGEHAFQVERIAYASGAPKYKKLCWIYGKTLLGVTDANELQMITVDTGGIKEFLTQKIPFKVKDIAVNQPDNQHEIILCDTDDNLYYAHLADKNAAGAIKYYKIYEKELQHVYRNPIDQAIDRVWYFKNKVGVLNITTGDTTLFYPNSYRWQSPQAIVAWMRSQLSLGKK